MTRLLKLEPQQIPDLILPWRRRARLRTVLQALRKLKRTGRLRARIWRQDQDLYIEFERDADEFWFTLAWPADLPQWHEP